LATRPCRSSSARMRSRSCRAASALPPGGHRCEPGDVTLRDEALRHPGRLPSEAAVPRRRSAPQRADARLAQDSPQARSFHTVHCGRGKRRGRNLRHLNPASSERRRSFRILRCIVMR
jgi:hypothetical protein